MSRPDAEQTPTPVATFYAADRAAWRTWLEQHRDSDKGVWLVYDKAREGERRLSYDAIVEEALCFGWVDSKPGKAGDGQAKLYVAPRKAKSPWSQINKRRVEQLIASGRMTPAGLEKVEAAKRDGSWNLYDAVDALEMPDDLLAALDANPAAKANFAAFSPSSKKTILWWIVSARRAETRALRIQETVRLAAQNIKANHYRQ